MAINLQPAQIPPTTVSEGMKEQQRERKRGRKGEEAQLLL